MSSARGEGEFLTGILVQEELTSSCHGKNVKNDERQHTDDAHFPDTNHPAQERRRNASEETSNLISNMAASQSIRASHKSDTSMDNRISGVSFPNHTTLLAQSFLRSHRQPQRWRRRRIPPPQQRQASIPTLSQQLKLHLPPFRTKDRNRAFH